MNRLVLLQGWLCNRLSVTHYRLEQLILDEGVELDRGMMSRYVDEAGGTWAKRKTPQ